MAWLRKIREKYQYEVRVEVEINEEATGEGKSDIIPPYPKFVLILMSYL